MVVVADPEIRPPKRRVHALPKQLDANLSEGHEVGLDLRKDFPDSFLKEDKGFVAVQDRPGDMIATMRARAVASINRVAKVLMDDGRILNARDDPPTDP